MISSIFFPFQISFLLSSYVIPLSLISFLYVGMLSRLWSSGPPGKGSKESRYEYKNVCDADICRNLTTKEMKIEQVAFKHDHVNCETFTTFQISTNFIMNKTCQIKIQKTNNGIFNFRDNSSNFWLFFIMLNLILFSVQNLFRITPSLYIFKSQVDTTKEENIKFLKAREG